ncbi:TonB-dependent receptor [Sphingobacterium sp. JB170]|uniref:TonB-dependent receptor n=1 Tax=Sphingobacterium sp. JB170 TaxID=1434842 RepID=UPI00097F00F2|nr:TonB-dependent receptor [Sphingobacterium sp. JB170]SJN22997.1 TonB-dependent siderophore receptor [Sphingobacterium sp. JB170]
MYSLFINIRNLKQFKLYLSLIILSITFIPAAFSQQGILQKKVTIQVNRVKLSEAITVVEKAADCSIAYSETFVNSDRVVSLNVTNQPLSGVLEQLFGELARGMQVKGNQINIQPSKGRGTVSGVVYTSDGQPAGFVSIGIRGQRSTQANDRGQFRLENIETGTYTITASFVGLQTQQQQIAVVPDGIVNVTFTLNEDAQTLQEVVVNGMPVNKVVDTPSRFLRIQSPLMETPQNILSIGSTTFKEQQLLTPSEITKNISGITDNMPYAGASTGFSIRGTSAGNNRLRNGMPISTLIGYGILQEDMSYIENIEFIKGPAGFMLAQGEPGGMFNVVTKKPLSYKHASIEFMTGSYGLYRTSVDVGAPLSEKVSYRLNVMGQKSGTHVNYGQNNRFSIAPVIQYKASDRTNVTLEYNMDVAGLLATNNVMPTVDRQPLPRDLLVGDPAVGQTKLSNNYGYVHVEHHLDDNWKITSQAGVMLARWKGKDLYSLNAIVDPDGLLTRRYRYIEFYDDFYTAQAFINGNFRSGSVSHQLLVGIDGGILHTKGKHADVRNILPINVYDPLYGLSKQLDTLIDIDNLSFGYDNTPNSLGVPQTMSWQAVMIQDQLTLAPWIQLTLGGRYTYYSNGSTSKPEVDKVFSPRAGLLVHPFSNTSIYALYDQSFLQQPGQSFDGSKFEPLTGNNIEFGIKRQWLEKALFTQISAYRITKNNVLTADIDNPGFSAQWGQIRSEGIEVDIMGNLTPGLQLTANYAYINAKVTKDADPLLIGTRPTNPIHNGNIWLTYRFSQGTLKGFGLGAGTSYQKDRYVVTFKKEDTDKQQKLPNYKSIDAALYYNRKKVSFALNLYNLADTYNFSANSFNYLAGKSGEFFMKSMPGRNFRFSIRYSL